MFISTLVICLCLLTIGNLANIKTLTECHVIIRLNFTSDGKLLIAPAGCLQVEDEKNKQSTQQVKFA